MTFLSFEDLRARGVPYSKGSLRRLEKEGAFPRRRNLGPRRVAWVEAEISEYLNRVAQ